MPVLILQGGCREVGWPIEELFMSDLKRGQSSHRRVEVFY